MQKSNVTVCIRSRPLFPTEHSEAFSYSSTAVNLLSSGNKSPTSFSFDHVFPPVSSTAEVYEQVAKPMIGSVLEGYNATLFAYGQTTSGKTHTMIGTPENPGLIPLTVEDLFRIIEKSDRVYRIWVSYLEIYNEVANDLLQPRSINLKLRENPSDGCYVLGLKQVRVYNSVDVMQVLEIGERNKHYRETKIHDHSSRSHSVFKLLIDSTERGRMDFEDCDSVKKAAGIKTSVFNLVDLAGSERLNDAGSGSITETSHINTSLFVLTKVINKLADGPTGHVPYRDSKLTRILSSALGGNSLTVIICTLAPALSNLQLSLSTLRFASRAKAIINKPIINEILDDSELIESLRSQIRRLEKMLSDHESIGKLELSRLLQENADLKSRLQMKDETTKVLHEVRFMNVEVSDLIAKHQELQRNFDIQLTLRTELLRENNELKTIGMIGFDYQKAKVEGERREQVSKTRDDWMYAIAKMRMEYLQELSALDELFYEQMHTWLDAHQTVSEPKENVAGQTQVRPKTKQQRKTAEAPKGTPPKPPVRPGTSLKSIRGLLATRSSEPNPEKRPRSSSRRLIPKPLVTPPRMKYRELELDSDSSGGFSDGETTNPPFSAQTPIPQDEEGEEKRPEFMPPPIDEICTESEGAVPFELRPGSNVLLYGMNKDSCCGHKKALQCKTASQVNPEFQQIACGYAHTAGIDPQGILYTFGRGCSGQLGLSHLTTIDVPQPVTHPLHGVLIKKVCCGADHTMCITVDGRLFAWGYNGEGQLGLGDQYDRMRPFRVSYLDMAIKDVSAGFYHSAAVTEDGVLYTWGANPDGRLFRPPIKIRHQKFKVDTVPIKVHDLENVAQVKLGKTHSILCTTDGVVYTAGSNNHGELGISPTSQIDQPFHKVAIFVGTLRAKGVACGDSFCAVLTQMGSVYTFGKGGDGRLGLGNTYDCCTPKTVSSNLKFKKVECGARHVLAVGVDEELYTWGCGNYSQLCSEGEDDQLIPTCVDLSGKTGFWAKEIACGHYHSAIITM